LAPPQDESGVERLYKLAANQGNVAAQTALSLTN